MSQSGTPKSHPSKGHTPDGSSGASQLGQGSSGCTCWLDHEGYLDEFEQQVMDFEDAARERAAADQACFDFAARYRHKHEPAWPNLLERLVDPLTPLRECERVAAAKLPWFHFVIPSRTPETD